MWKMRTNIIARPMRSTYCCFLLVLFLSSCSRQPQHPAPPLINQDVVIAISSLKQNIPVFYTYQYRERPISFFVLKINDKVSCFLDACASCYPEKRGYRFDNGSIVCRACDMKFSVYQLEKGLGGCFPIKIEGRVEKGEYHIPVSMLEGSVDKF